jgi:hypothetical protein
MKKNIFFMILIFSLVVAILSVAIDIVNLMINYELLRVSLNTIIFIGIIILIIYCRNYYCFIIGFFGFLIGTSIMIIILKYYFPYTTTNIYKSLIYGIYFFIIGTSYRRTLDKKYNIKNIIIFCISLFITQILIIGFIGNILIIQPLLRKLIISDNKLLLGIVCHNIILLIKYIIKKRKYVA